MAVSFDRAVKFEFSSGDVEFDAQHWMEKLSCVGTTPPPTSLISDCGDFVLGPSVAICSCGDNSADGRLSGSQTFEMNVTSLPIGGRTLIFKTTSNGSNFFGNHWALTVGVNTITVPAVTFDKRLNSVFKWRCRVWRFNIKHSSLFMCRFHIYC